LNSNGNLISSQLYGPYGNSRYSSGTLPTSIGFTGQQSDSVTGLDYYVARYYEPMIGVFLSPDDVQGNEQGASPYEYVGDNPETETDPTGHCPFCVVIPFLAAAAEAVVDVAAAVVAIVAAPEVLTAILVVGIVILGAMIVRTVVAAQKSSYEPNSNKHKSGKSTAPNGQSSGAEPTNAQSLWDNRDSSSSTVWKVPGESGRWVGYDPETGEIIIFDDTNNGTFHSHVETWSDLGKGKQDIQNVLSKQGIFNPKTGKLNQSWVDNYYNQKAQQEEEAQQEAARNLWRKAKWFQEWGNGDE